uniref:Uncharacterized protein n=1 Tax=Ciona savignyi TaxID=51511 RepID=H2ZJ97_CIOSA
SLDEGTCFRVYNPAKPHISGIKLYELHEAKTGYCFNFKLHTGQERQQSHCKTFDLVMSLMANYLDKGHSLYMGRYYSSPKLYDALFTRLTTATGTCMVNRKDLPQVFIKQKLKRGGAISCRKSNLMALKWRDKRDVLMLSTIHNNERSDVSVHTPGGRRLKSKPVVVQDYNKNMVGVDHHDQMMAYYGFSKKSMKWYKKLFFHLISITTVNAHIVYNKVRLQHGNPKITLLQFIEELVKELAMETTNKIGQKEQATSSTLQGPAGRLMGRHFISRQPGDHHKSCVVCNQKSRYNRVTKKIKYKRSSFWCERCGVTLCKVPCFEEYHS